jgi:hypothetical protein
MTHHACPSRLVGALQATRQHEGEDTLEVIVSRNEIDPAIPAYAPKVLRDYGSEQLSERFDHPVVSFEVIMKWTRPYADRLC